MLSFWIFLSSGLFLGWSLGTQDASNIFGTAVGTRMIKFRTAAIIASIFVIIGAVCAGDGTATTLNRLGTVNAPAGAFMVGMAAALAIYAMTRKKIPVSSSQSIVGAIIGWNLYSGAPTDIGILSQIVSTWFICPVLSGIFAVIIFKMLKYCITAAKISLLRQDFYIRTGLILVGAFGSFALGANNIANVMGVFIESNPLKPLNFFNFFSLNAVQVLFLLGAIAIAVGICTYSRKMMMTIGNGIYQLSPFAALAVVFSQALVLFLFASTGLNAFLTAHGLPGIPLVPVSSSQAVTGAVMGIGIFKGGNGLRWNLIGKIVTGWVFTPAIAAAICFICLFFLENVFNLTVYN